MGGWAVHVPSLIDWTRPEKALHRKVHASGDSYYLKALIKVKGVVDPLTCWGRAITGSTDCSEDSTSRHQRLWARALDSRWKLSRTDFKVKKELSRTLKSTLYQASWQGVDVVVKCAGLHDDDMARQLRSNEGLLRSSGLRSDADQEDRAISDELLHEIDLLSSLRHPDLVMFLGACIEPHMPIMCVTEFLPGGDAGLLLWNLR